MVGNNGTDAVNLKRFIPIILTLAVGLSASLAMWYVTSSWESGRTRTNFAAAAQERTESFSRNITSIINGVNSFSGLYAASNRIDKSEYTTYSRFDNASLNALKVLVWAPAVSVGEKQRFETEEAVRDQVTNYRIVSTATNPAVFFPVYYTEPSANGYYTPGQDLYANPLYTEAMNSARDSAKVTVTGRIAMHGGGYGVAFISPIYRNGTTSTTIAERRENLAGFNIYLIHVGELFENSLGGVTQESDLNIAIVDESAQGDARELHRHQPAGDASTDGGYLVASSIMVGGRSWSVTCTPTPLFIESRHTAQPLIIFLLILISTLTMAAVLYSVLRKGERVAHLAAELEASHAGLEDQVAQRTAALQEQADEMRKQAEELSKANDSIEEQTRAIIEMSIPVIKIWDEIVLIPLIGTVDTARANDMIARLLKAIVEHNAEVVLLDVTGVPVIDTSVARNIIQAVSSARILGAEMIVTGFSPEAAQTLAQLGVDFTSMKTRGSLRAGIEDAYEMVGVEINTH